MLDLDGERIENVLHNLSVRISADKGKLADLKREQTIIVAQEKILSSAISNWELYVGILHNAFLVSRGLPDDIALIRNNLIGYMQESKRKDILISRKEGLELEIKARKKGLQELCKHQFVIGRVGHDSYDNGETSWVFGYRLCVVCGFGENAMGGGRSNLPSWREGGDIFPTLNEDASRVIDKHGLNSRNPFYIWQPLEEVLKHFVDKRVYEIIKIPL